MGSAWVRARLRELLDPVVAAAGADLEDVTVAPAGRRSVVRVVVDRDGGVSLDDLAELSHAASAALDAVDVPPGPYVLEVTSPGVERPLTEPRHWRRATGRLVHARLRDGASVTGRILAADEAGIVLAVVGAPGPRRLSYPELTRGRVEVEFRRDEEPDETEDRVGAGRPGGDEDEEGSGA